ncbi:MAG: lamin tail domain-containing protein [Bacteroidales bacterium]|nr:lamin tail domain-containing protein [Bacteroidales bacterium]
MNKIGVFLAAAALFSAIGAGAQNQNSMRLNEVLVENTENAVDDYGQHSAWIELYNTSAGTVDIGGCYFTDDESNLRKFRLPKGDNRYKIKPFQTVMFWADGLAERGIFHTGVTLAPGSDLIFVGSDGKTIIDRLVIPATLQENCSMARITDGAGSKDGSVQGWCECEKPTPGMKNSKAGEITKAETAKLTDPHGFIATITAMFVVLLALAILYRIFKRIGQLTTYAERRQAAKEAANASAQNDAAAGAEPAAVQTASSASPVASQGDTAAAIATALHLYAEEQEGHDIESLVVTIGHNRTVWNSKAKAMRQTPTIKKQ